ncbi:MAG: 30S ribosomal protein S17 [Syntrophobacterales bacterium]|nr:30S ribosomal protein S17 [Syntrophobacterales bacterium]
MEKRGKKTTIEGVVISDKMDKTIVVRVERLVKHPIFHKYVKRFVKYKSHDEGNDCRKGDRVMIAESRPLSKEKRWRMVQIVEKAK